MLLIAWRQRNRSSASPVMLTLDCPAVAAQPMRSRPAGESCHASPEARTAPRTMRSLIRGSDAKNSRCALPAANRITICPISPRFRADEEQVACSRSKSGHHRSSAQWPIFKSSRSMCPAERWPSEAPGRPSFRVHARLAFSIPRSSRADPGSPSTSPQAARADRSCPVRRAPGTCPATGLLPATAALGEDALQEHRGGLVVAALGAGQLGLGRHQPPLDGGLEHRGPIPLQVPLHPLQRRHGVVEPGEVALDGLDDAVLLGEGASGAGRLATFERLSV